MNEAWLKTQSADFSGAGRGSAYVASEDFVIDLTGQIELVEDAKEEDLAIRCHDEISRLFDR